MKMTDEQKRDAIDFFHIIAQTIKENPELYFDVSTLTIQHKSSLQKPERDDIAEFLGRLFGFEE